MADQELESSALVVCSVVLRIPLSAKAGDRVSDIAAVTSEVARNFIRKAVENEAKNPEWERGFKFDSIIAATKEVKYVWSDKQKAESCGQVPCKTV